MLEFLDIFMKKLTLMLIPLVFAPNAIAESDKSNLMLEGSLGILNGSSTELVYDSDGSKLSQLDWDINNVPIIQLGATWNLNDNWTVKGSFWSILTDDGNANMKDRDWLDPYQSTPTDISVSPDTKLREAYEFDLNVTYWLISQQSYKLGVVSGYQYNTFKWDGIGGSFSYDNGADIGVFPDTVGIDYEQEFSALYLGLAGEYIFQQSEIGMLLKWSPWVNAKDVDNHNMRDLTFYEKGNESSDYLSLSLNYGYNFTSQVKLYVEYVYTKYFETKADTTIVENSTGDSYFIPNGAGLDNENSTISVGVKYTF
ncbi:omptin family outer membrane protease [Shewanella surugensis]|uniref:Omptin family outer membrane protease n=1 Tax=Shewanella surugensis TaxID=212020 RepID=A0ABT0LFX6_9GAMM|nr:omptin family outer membrane protease [Shewanella surugensis]MCL1126601.1 omptin family outer membrane protease [Shewanella surugensis]